MPQLVSTGSLTVVDVNDGLNARLTNDNVSVPTLADGSGGNYSSCVTTMQVFMGSTELTSTFTYTASASTGVTGTLSVNTYTVTNMTQDAGYVDITAARAGYPSLTCRFTIIKGKQGLLGPTIALIPSAAGFRFVDGVATPANQSIAFTMARRNTSLPVAFYATGGATLTYDNGQLSLANYMSGVPSTGAGDTAYLSLASFGNNDQVTVTAIVGDLSTSYTVMRVNNSTAEAGATRNVARGNWANGDNYAKGDMVLYGGYGWLCLVPHQSSGVITPPTFPATSNTYWQLTTYKGVDAKSLSLTASSYVFKVAKDSTLSPTSIALTPVSQNLTGNPVYAVTSGTATLTGTGDSRTLTAANLTTDQATIQITWDGMTDVVTVSKVREGSDAVSVVLGNEAHVLPADPLGVVTTYAGSGTTIQVYEGTTALTASASLTVSAFRVGTITQSPAATLTTGTVSYAGTTATVATHSSMAAGTDSVVLSIPITVYRSDGTSTVVTKVQTVTKGKQGSAGVSYLLNQNQSVSADESGAVASFAGIETQFKNFEGVNDTTNAWTYYVSDIGAGIAYRDSDDGAGRTASGYTVGVLGGENLLRQSQSISTSPWGAGPTLTLTGSQPAPDGTNTAFNYASTGVSGYCTQVVTILAATPYTASVFVKAVSGTGSFTLGVGSTGSTDGAAIVMSVSGATLTYGSSSARAAGTLVGYTVTAVDNGWFRISVTGTTAGTSGGVVLSATNGVTVAVWGAQLEKTSTATEYTPTTTAVASGTRGYLRVVSLSTDSSYIEITASRVGYASRTLRYTLTKNKAGVTGSSSAIVYLYRRSATAPALPSATVTYTFATGVATGLTNSWTQSIPTSNGNPLYVTVATAIGTGATATISSGSWAGAVVMTTDGVDGLSVSPVVLYRRTTTSSAPSVVTTGTATYTFATGAITGQPTGWTIAVPASSGGDYLWGIVATASSNTATDAILNTEWSSPQIVMQNGTRGTITTSAAVGSAAWSDSAANAAIVAAGGGSSLQGDIVTLYYTAGNFSQTRIYSSGGTWTILTAIFGGDVIVDRTLGATKIVSQSITAGEIAFGTITGDQIQANSITVGNLTVADPQNLAPGGDLIYTAGLPNNSRVAVTADSVNAYNNKSYVLLCSTGATTTYTRLQNNAVFTASSGEEFNFEWYGRAATAITGFVHVYIRWEDSSGAQISTSSVGILDTETTWTKFAGDVVAPSGVQRGTVWITSANTAGVGYIGSIRILRRNAGKLLVDGSITTDMLVSDVITTEKLRVGLRGATTQGITFSVAKGTNTLSWTAGNLVWIDDSGATITQPISAGSTTWTSGYRYVSFAKQAYSATAVAFNVSSTSTNYLNSGAYIPVALYEGGPTYTVKAGSTLIDGDTIIAGTLQGDRLVTNSVDAGVITGGTITADKLGSNTITARELAVTDFNNQITNGDLLNTAGLPSTGRVVWAADAANAYGGKNYVLVCVANATSTTVFFNTDLYISTFPGEKFYFEWWGKVGSTLTGSFTPQVRWVDKTNALISNTNVGSLSNQTTYTMFSGEMVAPANATAARISFSCANTAGTAYVGQMRLYRKNGALITADGTISGNLIAADAITTEKLRVGLRNANTQGITFTPNLSTNTLSWTAGQLLWLDDTGATISQPIAAGSVSTTLGSNRYISFAKQAYSATAVAFNASSSSSNYFNTAAYIPIALYEGGATYTVKAGSTVIDGSTIVAGSVNADRLVANSITAGQIGAGAITASELAASAVTASRVTVQGANMVLDPAFNDVDDGVTGNVGKYWVLGSNTIATGDADTAAMNVVAAVKCPVGNGTTSQSATETQTKAALNRMVVEPGGVYRVFAQVRVKAGYRGRPRIVIRWYTETGSSLSSSTVATDVSTGSEVTIDFRTVVGGAPADANYLYEGKITAPATAYYARYSCYFDYSTTQNNPATAWALMAVPVMVKASTGYMIVDGTIQANHIKVNSVTGDRITTNTLDGGKITAGTIWADRLAAGSITASALGVTDLNNYLVNADLRTWDSVLAAASAAGTSPPTVPDGWNRVVATGGSSVTVAFGSNWPSKYGLLFYRNTGNSSQLSIVNGPSSFDDTSMRDGIPCNPNDEFYFEAIVYTTNGTTYLDADMTIRTSTTAAASLTPVAKTNSSVFGGYLRCGAGASFSKVTGYFKYTGTSRGKAYLRLGHSTASSQNSNVYVWNPRLLKKANGELVVDGSITATHIDVVQLDAIAATIGVLRTATTGARMEIRDNVIKVYNSSNVLQVQIGDLSL